MKVVKLPASCTVQSSWSCFGRNALPRPEDPIANFLTAFKTSSSDTFRPICRTDGAWYTPLLLEVVCGCFSVSAGITVSEVGSTPVEQTSCVAFEYAPSLASLVVLRLFYESWYSSSGIREERGDCKYFASFHKSWYFPRRHCRTLRFITLIKV